MFRLLLEGVMALLWPPRTTCLLCEQRLAESEPLDEAESLPVCLTCWEAMAFGADTLRCICCKRPLLDGPGICLQCQSSPSFDQVWALGLHAGPLREAIHHLKFNGRKELGPALGIRLAELVARQYDLIIPLPLHPTRYRERGYNQAALIAQGLSEWLGPPVVEGALVRRRSTSRQARLDRHERLRNLEGAFGIAGSEEPAWVGRAVLLVDDVLTTGATAAAAAEVLWATGAAWVDLAVLAVSAKPVPTIGRVPYSPLPL